MTEKELKRLSRAELLELLLLQTKEREQLEQRLAQAEQMLCDRQLKLQQAGDIAKAALEINGVMEAAQKAAKQYLDNIAQMEQETQLRCEKILSEARQQAEQMLLKEEPEQELPPAEQPAKELPKKGYPGQKHPKKKKRKKSRR